MNPDLKKLTGYPEYYALRNELLKACEKLTDELKDLDIKDPTFQFQAGLKIEVIKKVEGLLITLGLVKREDFVKSKKTYE